MARVGLSLTGLLLLAAAGTLLVAEASGTWLTKVPAAEGARVNPLAEDSAAPDAGAQLYRRHCASCHGADAGGRGQRPSLRTERVRRATDGELQWLLRNGSLAKGMPAWSNLPEVQRWQLVRYLHTLPDDGSAK